MSYQKPARCVVVPIVILLLVLGMTFGMKMMSSHADNFLQLPCAACHLVFVPPAGVRRLSRRGLPARL